MGRSADDRAGDSDRSEYSNYSEKGFWKKLAAYGRQAGLDVMEKALLLYYTLQDDDVPVWAKSTIVGALGYFISMVDAIPDLTPVLGYSDDLVVLVMALAAVSTYIGDDAKRKARQRLTQWFGEESADRDDPHVS